MDIASSIEIFAALAQQTRLETFRLLVEAGPDGLPAGAISDTLGIPHNTLSFHLNHLVEAGIVRSRREGRSIIYTADFALMQELIGFLVKDCCRREFANIRTDTAKGCSVIELVDLCEIGKTASENDGPS